MADSNVTNQYAQLVADMREIGSDNGWNDEAILAEVVKDYGVHTLLSAIIAFHQDAAAFAEDRDFYKRLHSDSTLMIEANNALIKMVRELTELTDEINGLDDSE